MKCAKVICTYFGARRREHNTPENIEEFLEKVIEVEINIDHGMDTDIILINNASYNITRDYSLDMWNNWQTRNGNIRVFFRPNIGGSFGAYYYAFSQLAQEYDYWFFSEDDILIYKPGYIKDFADFLDSSPNLGFVSLAPISQSPFHSGGGCGLTSTAKFWKANDNEHMEKVMTDNSVVDDYGKLETYEVDFTNRFTRVGMEIKNHPNYSPLCRNYKLHLGQVRWANPINTQQEFIYEVGNNALSVD
jgi:hypothetical protein